MEDRPLAEQNLAAAIFRLERSSTPEDVLYVVQKLGEWLYLPEQESVQRALAQWINQVVVPDRLSSDPLPQVETLTEVKAMLAERVKQWELEWKQQGLEKGREEGLIEGIELALVIKFGDAPTSLLARIREIHDVDRLRALKEVIRHATTVEEVKRSLETEA